MLVEEHSLQLALVWRSTQNKIFKMKFVILLACIAFVAADVSEVNQQYLPPQEPAAAAPEPVAVQERFAVEEAAMEPAVMAHDEPAPAPEHMEAEAAHTLDADGYKYKSPF